MIFRNFQRVVCLERGNNLLEINSPCSCVLLSAIHSKLPTRITLKFGGRENVEDSQRNHPSGRLSVMKVQLCNKFEKEANFGHSGLTRNIKPTNLQVKRAFLSNREEEMMNHVLERVDTFKKARDAIPIGLERGIPHNVQLLRPVGSEIP